MVYVDSRLNHLFILIKISFIYSVFSGKSKSVAEATPLRYRILLVRDTMDL